MPTSILQKFSTHLRQSLKNSFKIALDLKHKQITPLHLLYGLIEEKGAIGSEILSKASLNKEKIISALVHGCQTEESTLKGMRPNFPELNEESQKILVKAAALAVENQHRYIGTEHLLVALVETKIPLLIDFLAEQKIDLPNLERTTLNVLQSTNRFPDLPLSPSQGGAGKETNQEAKTETIVKRKIKKMPALNFFATELTSAKSQKEMDPVIGRGDEINRLIQILCRRTKNNPVLLGDPGVGKTAIVEGLSQRIVNGAVPDPLQGKKIMRLDLGLLIAGTIYRGEFEARLKQLLDEVRENPEIILFIDELHTIVGAGSAAGTLDAANILKPALARGEVRCIGATTFEEYKKQIESDAALERRFQPVIVNEPSREETIAILKGIRDNYEKYHLIKISDKAILAAVDLSLRYRQDKFLPDKAIDLLDEAASAKKLTLKAGGLLRQLKNLQKEQQKIQQEKEEAVRAENFEQAVKVKEKEELLLQEIQRLEQKISQKRPRLQEILIAEDVAKIITLSTNIPTTELLEEDKKQLLNLENEMKKKIVGQDQAVAAVAQALRRARLGLAHPQRPLASFLLTGPSGVGKTWLAKVLAELIFKDHEAFIRLDMSEFSEGFQVSKLIGAPAGYVGYKEGNKFTDRVKARPYSVILFDEIDKAHPEAFNILLQILDEGHLSDAVGKKINFKNTVIIMTTNLGHEHFSPVKLGFQEGIATKEINGKQFESIKNSVLSELKDRFRPEFLNRLDSILVLRPLDRQDLEKIVDLQIADLNQRLEKKNLSLSLTPAARQFLAKKAQELDQGARAIAKVIQSEVEEPLTNWLLSQATIEKQVIPIQFAKGKIQIL